MWKTAFGAMRSSPKNAMQVECVEPPLALRRQYLANRFLIRAISNSNHLLIPRLQALASLVTVFTDASKSDPTKCVGAAVVIPKYNIVLMFKCPPESSIFTGEAVAILEAVTYADSHNITKMIIFTDSRSCLQAIVGNQFKMKTKFPLILQIKTLLRKCDLKGLKIVLGWIPGHCGIAGNESADLWARQAIEMGSPGHDKIYSSDLLSHAQTDLFNTWQNLWDSSRLEVGKHYGHIQPNIPRKPWFFKFRAYPKWATSTICRLRLGPVCTPVFLAKIRVRDTSLCECGFDEGTVDHIFFSCPRFNYSLYDVLPENIPRPINFYSLLTLMDPPLTSILIKYIQEHDIKL